jgi:hypothetical protein
MQKRSRKTHSLTGVPKNAIVESLFLKRFNTLNPQIRRASKVCPIQYFNNSDIALHKSKVVTNQSYGAFLYSELVPASAG